MSHPSLRPLIGLVAATHTPFDSDGNLRLSVVEDQAALLIRDGVTAVFIGGTTGESHSLTLDERLALSQRWSDVVKGAPLRLVIHVGSNCLADAEKLAEQAQTLGADSIAAIAPSYFKPKNTRALVACCAAIASAAPELPFYHYDIPALTGLHLSMPEFLDAAAETIPSLVGIKFSNPDLMAYQHCVRSHAGSFDIPWGIDEYLLAALALGAQGGVGSSYNFAAPLYLRLVDDFKNNRLAAARAEQYRSVQLIQTLAGHGYMPAAKAVMKMRGVDVGPPRLPHEHLSTEETTALRTDLEKLGFFEWIK